jgi:hypothetical protein
MPEANSMPVSPNLKQTQEYFLHSSGLALTPFLSPCGGRGEGEGVIVKRLILLRQIAFMARCKTDRLSGLIRKSPLAPLFQRGG